MTKIEEFLTHFDDQRLANLQCAVEDERLVYYDTCGCLLHHRSGNYSVTKSMGEHAELARLAELEFYHLGTDDPEYKLRTLEEDDVMRRKAILPLIHAEWARRVNPVPITFEQAEKQEVLSGK